MDAAVGVEGAEEEGFGGKREEGKRKVKGGGGRVLCEKLTKNAFTTDEIVRDTDKYRKEYNDT